MPQAGTVIPRSTEEEEIKAQRSVSAVEAWLLPLLPICAPCHVALWSLLPMAKSFPSPIERGSVI